MSTIESKKDATYKVPSNALVPLVDDAGVIAKSVTSAQLLAAANGEKIITVGVGGLVLTIQDAIDFIVTQPAFTQIVMDNNGTVGTWNIDTDNITCTATDAGTPTTAPAQFITPVPVDKVWFKVAGDNYYYPLENIDDITLSAASIISGMKRIEANVTGTPEIEWFIENTYTIKLLDDYTNEAFTISENCHITFDGNGNNTFQFVMSNGVGYKSGTFKTRNLLISAISVNGAWNHDAVNTIKLDFSESKIQSVHDDFIFPTGVYVGSLRVEHAVISSQPTNVQGHILAPNFVRGDVIISNITWNPICHASNHFTPDLNAVLVDKCVGVRNIIVNGVKARITDGVGRFAEISIIGAQLVDAEQVLIDDITIDAPNVSTTIFSAIQVSNRITSAIAMSINNFHVQAPNNLGSSKLVHKISSPGVACTIGVGRGNTILASDSDANLSYTQKKGNVNGSGLISGATNTVITHGLGYIPNLADIHIMFSLITTTSVWYIATITDTTFTMTFNTSVVAQFEWYIGK